MSKKSDDRKNVVIVGGGYGGFNLAKALTKALDASRYEIIVVTPKPYFVHVVAGLRIVVTAEGQLEDQALIPYDRVGGVTVRQGVVTAIEEAEHANGAGGGEVVLEGGDRLQYAVLVLATGSTWSGPITSFTEGSSDKAIRDGIALWRKRFAGAKHVVIVGGGAGGLGTAEGLRESGFSGKITILSKGARSPRPRTRSC